MNVPANPDGSTGVRSAATVMLVRSKQPTGGLEVFMVRRSSRSPFAPDAVVFPGGAVDEQDAGDPRRAALRELFEEAGVLIALTATGGPVAEAELAPHRTALAGARARIADGTLPFVDALAGYGWSPDSGALVAFSRWITPPNEPRRYDTHFFLARAPEGQTPLADARETHDGRWIEPGAALEEYGAGRLRLVYPTIKHLERLARFADVASLVEYAKTKTIVTVAPHTSPDTGYVMPAALESNW